MKIFEIVDGEVKSTIGCLLYFEKEKSYIIELRQGLTEWTAPLIFANRVKNGQLTFDRELSLLWVKERVIPSGRQNIGSILANAGLRDYNEIDFLEAARGRCSQDSLYIKKLQHLPDYVAERQEKNLQECVLCDDYSLLCFFKNGNCRKVALEQLAAEKDVEKILKNRLLYKSGHIAAGGYCLTFNDSIDISVGLLYESGIEVPLSINDFLSFVRENILDTSECCELCQCSRQNLSHLISKGSLSPIKKDVKGNLYLKGNVIISSNC